MSDKTQAIIEDASRRAKAAIQIRKEQTTDMLENIKAVKGEAIACTLGHMVEADTTLRVLMRIAIQAVPPAQREQVSASFNEKCGEIMVSLFTGMCASHDLTDEQEAEAAKNLKPLLETYDAQIAALDRIGADTQAKLQALRH